MRSSVTSIATSVKCRATGGGSSPSSAGTIGNLDPSQRSRFLFDVDAMLDHDEWFLLGTDLVKDRARLVAAYDDAAGVTAAFNRNALGGDEPRAGRRLRPRRLRPRRPLGRGAQLDRDAPRRPRTAGRAGGRSRRPRGALRRTCEWLRTEISAKFTADGIRAELWNAGLVVEHQWTDDDGDYLLTLARPYC